jgi:outer membrane immunogenic protein
MRMLVVASAIAGVIGNAAFAADMPVKGKAVEVAENWGGWYVGINGGGAWGSVNPSVHDIGPDSFFAGANVPAVVAGGSQGFNPKGGLAGAQIGYLVQGGGAIAGLELAVDWASLRGSVSNGPTLYPVTPPSTFSWNSQGKVDALATLLGRLGVNMGAWFPYVTGGVAISHLTYTTTYIDTFYPSTSGSSFSKYAPGFVVGAGAEFRMAQHWLLRVEYLYMEFNSVGGKGLIACTPGVGNCVGAGFSTTFLYNTSFTENVVRAALSYRF